MPELDLGPAIEAAAEAMFVATRGANMYYNPPSWSEISTSNQESWRYSASKAIEAALPALRKAIAEELKEFARQAAKTDSPDAILGLLTASVIVSGQRFDSYEALADQLDELVRGQSGGGDG